MVDTDSNDSSLSSDEWDDVNIFKSPLWSDITPIYLTSDETKLANISYTNKFRIYYAYFRAIFQKNEISERGFQLSTECINLNPANYTAWHYRRKCLFELNKDIFVEFDFLDSIIIKNQKNYQIWQHRKLLVKHLNHPYLEKKFTEKVILDDPKNYHAWQYRQWVISKYNLYDGELNYTKELIKNDIRNNSAWNHRFYVLKNNDMIISSIHESEIKFTLETIKFAFENESPWNYLVGILGKENICDNQIVNKFIDEYKNKQNSPHFHSFRLDQLLLKLSKQDSSNENIFKEAIDLATELAYNYDKIREKYWLYLVDTIRSRFSK